MNKKIAILLLWTIGSVSYLQAQTFAEWFKQKKTQIKYLGQQIASLQVYAGYLEKGYQIANKGLTTIGDIKNGEFNLHKDYFGSLKSVNPSIAKDARIAAIIALQVSIVQQYKKCYGRVQQSSLFNSNEVDYVYTVFTHLLNDCTNDLTELISVTTIGQLQLTDDERLRRIDGLYKDMQDKYSFAQSFSNETGIMMVARMKDSNDAGTLNYLYHLK
jgi:hypothetical protein